MAINAVGFGPNHPAPGVFFDCHGLKMQRINAATDPAFVVEHERLRRQFSESSLIKKSVCAGAAKLAVTFAI
jgi:hypothetical protein